MIKENFLILLYQRFDNLAIIAFGTFEIAQNNIIVTNYVKKKTLVKRSTELKYYNFFCINAAKTSHLI